MMGALLPGGGIASMGIIPGMNAFLDRFYYFLIFHLHSIQSGAGPFIKLRFVGHVGKEGYFCLLRADGLDDIHGKTPGIEIEHHIRKDKEIISGYFFAIIRRGRRQVKTILFVLSDAELEVGILKKIGRIVAEAYY